MSSVASDREPGPSMWIRWRQIGLIVVVLVVLAMVLFMARGALFPFIISIVLAELLYPVVSLVETHLPGHDRYPKVTRIIAILAIYVGFAGSVAVVLYLTIPPLFSEAQEFIQTFPQLYERARSAVEGWSHDFTQRIPVELRSEIEDTVAAGGAVLASAAQGIVLRTISGVSNAVTLVIGLAIVPFLLFFLLKDRESILEGLYAPMSPRNATHARNVLNMVNGVIGAYVRAQLLSAVIVGTLVFIGLSILGIHFAATLGLVAGLFGLIPIIGPLLGAVPGILVTLASSPERVVWVVLVYVVVQLIENNAISPRIHSRAVRLHPAIIMAALVIASELAGLWGVIVAVPLTAAARDVVVYFYRAWSSDDAPSKSTAADAGQDLQPAAAESLSDVEE